MRWVAGDEVYGDATELRDLVARNGRWYVLAVRTPTQVWIQRPAVVEPEPQKRGRPRTKVRLADGAAPATTVKDVVVSWPENRWQRLTVAEGEKGLIRYDWACQRVVVSRRPLQSDGETRGPEPFLAELTVPEVRRLLEVALPLPYRSRDLRLAWSL